MKGVYGMSGWKVRWYFRIYTVRPDRIRAGMRREGSAG